MPPRPAARRRIRSLCRQLRPTPSPTASAPSEPAAAAAPKITRVEVRTVAPEVARFRWDDSLPEFFCTNTVVRILTDSGVEGVAGVSNYTNYDFDRYTAECTRHIIPILLGQDPLMREELHALCGSRVFPYPPRANAVIDIALWDLAGKIAGLPVYQLLGGHSKKIRAYTSTPMFDSVAEYMEWIDWAVSQGFVAVKFHCWNVFEKDLELARAARARFPNLTFMLDVENNYSFADAEAMAAELTALGGYAWFEAPLFDSDTRGYQRLTARSGVDIIPSGNWIQDLPNYRECLDRGCWSRGRCDAVICGGLTPGKKYLAMAESFGMPTEVMSWGNTLGSGANLHLMCSSSGSSYFEMAVPYEPYEYGMLDVIRPDDEGYVHAPSGPGLGLRVDWEAMEDATVHRIAVGEGEQW